LTPASNGCVITDVEDPVVQLAADDDLTEALIVENEQFRVQAAQFETQPIIDSSECRFDGRAAGGDRTIGRAGAAER